MKHILTEQEIYNIIDYLQGTCLSINEAISQVLGYKDGIDEISNETELYSFIDDDIFLCSKCGWWYESGDWIDDSHPDWDPAEETCTSCGD